MGSFASILAVWIFVGTCNSIAAARPAPPKPDLRPIEHRFVELSVKEERHLLRTAEEWRRFWQRFDKSPPPEVDFSRHDLVVFLMGTRGSGGYSAHVLEPSGGKNGKLIRVLVCRPASGSVETAEITSPYDLKLVPKSTGSPQWKIIPGFTGQEECKNY